MKLNVSEKRYRTVLLGLETEFALVTDAKAGGRAKVMPSTLLERAVRQTASLPAIRGQGIFLGNGGRFYIDAGGHPEYCTPEVDNPWDLVSCVRAGERLVAQWALGEDAREPGMGISRGGVDYGGAGTTWACHENYGHQAEPEDLPSALVPHLVSRIIYTGAGGLNPLSPGIEFCLSPRACHLTRVISCSSTQDRGIFHTKDEPLAGGAWHRLHVLSGDALASDVATFLKLGTTALVLSLAEAGELAVAEAELEEPLTALRRFNRDPTCRARARLRDGRRRSALELQKWYLGQVQQRLGGPALPRWAEAVCDLWERTLLALEADPESLHRRLDWSIRRSLHQRLIAASGFTPEALDIYTWAVEQLHGACSRARIPRPWSVTWLLEGEGPLGEDAAAVRRLLRLHGLKPDVLPQFAGLRSRLAELDTRFGLVGTDGIFASLEAAGLLDHRVTGVTKGRIRRVLNHPPKHGRAWIRGQVVRRLAREPAGCECDWSMIWDARSQRLMDLSDPLLRQTPAWQHEAPGPPTQNEPLAGRLVEDAHAAFRRGRYLDAWRLLDFLDRQGTQFLGVHQSSYWFSRFYVECRLGNLNQALNALEHRRNCGLAANTWVVEHVALFRLVGLVPRDEIWPWIERGDALFSPQSTITPTDRCLFLGHKGRALAVVGRLEESHDTLKEALALAETIPDIPRVTSRTLTDHAETLRLRGETGQALEALERAEALQRQHGLHGDRAEFTGLVRAKVAPTAPGLAEQLAAIQRVLDRAGNPVGQARALLLEARLFPQRARERPILQRVHTLREGVPSLRDCPVAQAILDRWDTWLEGGRVSAWGAGFFQGL